MSDVETSITPPEVDDDGDGDDNTWRLSVNYLGCDEVHYDAAVQRFSDDNPDDFADALLNVSLVLASMRGPDYAWAVMQKFAAYDGMSR